MKNKVLSYIGLSLSLLLCSCSQDEIKYQVVDGNILVSLDGGENWHQLSTNNDVETVVGEKGEKGDKGDTGSTGPKGDKGETGQTGAKGDKEE